MNHSKPLDEATAALIEAAYIILDYCEWNIDKAFALVSEEIEKK